MVLEDRWRILENSTWNRRNNKWDNEKKSLGQDYFFQITWIIFRFYHILTIL